jgi:hypothetical protein
MQRPELNQCRIVHFMIQDRMSPRFIPLIARASVAAS